ncbi:MAG: cytochrome c [Desulfuromonadaceae bacterium]
MNAILKVIILSAAAIAMTVAITGCGDDRGDNVPAVKLTASAVVSDLTNGHGHNVEIPFSDMDLASDPNFTATIPFQYRSSDNTGHSHVIALSKLQMIDLNNGMRVTLTSSVPDTSTSHTHVWNLLGGGILYDKHCYNCHTNDKRGHNPMNVVFNAAQTSAVTFPAAQPLSTSPAATPDPGFMPVLELSLDGVYLYDTYCAGCHGPLASSTKSNRTAAQIKLGMGTMGLSDAQIQAIATALIK